MSDYPWPLPPRREVNWRCKFGEGRGVLRRANSTMIEFVDDTHCTCHVCSHWTAQRKKAWEAGAQ